MIISIFFSFFTSLLVVGFNSQGTGDLNIKAISHSIISIEIYIEDTLKYDVTEHSKTANPPQSTSYNIYDNFSYSLTDWEVSYDQKIQNNGASISLENPTDRTKNVMVSRISGGKFSIESTEFSTIHLTNSSDSNYHHIVFKKQGTSLTVTLDDITNIITISNNFNVERTPKFRIWSNNTVYIKNLKIKKL